MLVTQSAWAVEYINYFSAEGKPLLNPYLVYESKQSDGEVPVMLELWAMWSIPLLSSLPGSLWLGLVTPDRVLSIGQIEVNSVHILN